MGGVSCWVRFVRDAKILFFTQLCSYSLFLIGKVKGVCQWLMSHGLSKGYFFVVIKNTMA